MFHEGFPLFLTTGRRPIAASLLLRWRIDITTFTICIELHKAIEMPGHLPGQPRRSSGVLYEI
jgi:hypothetical protein